MKFTIRSLGCKISQFDSQSLRDGLLATGAVPAGVGEVADIFVINTCTVTKKSDYQCRQAIRKAVSEKPEGGRVLVTGCYALTNPDEIKSIPGVDLIAGMEELINLELSGANKAAPLTVSSATGRSRAYLKVQEGCNAYCSYCIVPYARGRSRSAPSDEIIQKADALIKQGFHEIVLTGVHLGAYGGDLTESTNLASLTKKVLARPGLGRLRLSSLEPGEFDDNMMDVVSSEAGKMLCRHFHLPLQSASDKVLESMGRRYRFEDYLKVVERLDRLVSGSCIGADVIVGYPIEDRADFEETYKRIEDSPINYLHVFAYSPRPGTRAYAMGDKVRGDEKKYRSHRLRELAEKKNAEFRRGFEGNTMTVVVEDKGGNISGLTDNYIRIALTDTNLVPKSAVSVVIERAEDGTLTGRVK